MTIHFSPIAALAWNAGRPIAEAFPHPCRTPLPAELKLTTDMQVPEEFLLYVPADGIAYRCTLRWRAKDRAGVAFSGTEAKPHWHYG